MCKREIISMIHLALYGRLPYMNSLFYPYIDPITGLPIIDAGIMACLDPNSNKSTEMQQNMDFNQLSMNLSMQMTGAGNISMENQDYYQNYPNVDQNQYMEKAENYGQYQGVPNQEQNYYGNNNQIDDYNNPKNYDLYYQSLYQMYPQMSDYVKKQENDEKSYILFNMGILDPQSQENNLYDPNFISNYYRMNMKEGGQVENEEERPEGNDVYDPYNIKEDMGDVSNIIKKDEQKKTVKAEALVSEVDYSKYDFNKYVEQMYSNQGGKGKKGRDQKNKPSQTYKFDDRYDKNEVNEDVSKFYESFYKEELETQPKLPNQEPISNTGFSSGFNSIQEEGLLPQQPPNEHIFEKPMPLPRRKSRFDDVGPVPTPIKTESPQSEMNNLNEGDFSGFGNGYPNSGINEVSAHPRNTNSNLNSIPQQSDKPKITEDDFQIESVNETK